MHSAGLSHPSTGQEAAGGHPEFGQGRSDRFRPLMPGPVSPHPSRTARPRCARRRGKTRPRCPRRRGQQASHRPAAPAGCRARANTPATSDCSTIAARESNARHCGKAPRSRTWETKKSTDAPRLRRSQRQHHSPSDLRQLGVDSESLLQWTVELLRNCKTSPERSRYCPSPRNSACATSSRVNVTSALP